jgi:hypothetical protein
VAVAKALCTVLAWPIPSLPPRPWLLKGCVQWLCTRGECQEGCKDMDKWSVPSWPFASLFLLLRAAASSFHFHLPFNALVHVILEGPRCPLMSCVAPHDLIQLLYPLPQAQVGHHAALLCLLDPSQAAISHHAAAEYPPPYTTTTRTPFAAAAPFRPCPLGPRPPPVSHQPNPGLCLPPLPAAGPPAAAITITCHHCPRPLRPCQ